MLKTARLLLALAGIHLGLAQAAEPAIPPPTDLAGLQSQLTKLMQDAGVPGAGIALFDRSGVSWAGGLGYADLAAKRPVTADTLFRVGSITKSFTAIALLQLAERHAIDLDARLKDIAPEIPVKDGWDKTDPVTVAEVLEHTAGFDDMHFPRLYDFHEAADIPLLTVLQRSAPELKVRWRPGTRVSYSNPDYLIAGYLIEKFSGESYEHYVITHVLRPLGLDRASLTLDPVTLAGLAQGYVGTPPARVDPVQIYLRPAGELSASPLELANLGILLLNRGQWHNAPFLSSVSVTRMETPKTSLGAQHGLEFGYGFADYTSYLDGYEFHGHDGGIDGFISRYAYAPDQGVGFVLLVNTGTPGKFMRAASKLLAAYVMRGQPEPLTPPLVAADPKELEQAAGYYRQENPRNQVLAVVDYLFGVGHLVPDGKGGLVFTPAFDDAETLVSAGTGLWRHADAPGPDTALYIEDGREVLDLQPNAGGAWLVKTSWLSAWGPLWLVCLAVLLMLSSVVMAPVWLLRLLLGQMQGLPHWEVRLLPLTATTAFAFMLGGAVGIQPQQLGSANAHTVIFFAGSVLFALCSVLAMIQAVRSLGWEMNRVARAQAFFASLACFGLTLFLSYWGLIGLRTWDF